MLPINRKISLVNWTDRNTKPKYIVVHYVGAVSTAKNNADYFYSAYRGASAHYFVDENSIWQVVDDLDSAWHCGSETGVYYHSECRNTNSIGIEMCVKKKNSKWYFEDATVNNTIELIKYLMDKYDIPVSNVIRHYDVTHKKCPEPYVRDAAAWNAFKAKLTSGGSNSVVDTTTKNETYKLVKACSIYMNSANAANRKNSVGTYVAGTYYVFNESNGMINITKTKGVAGGWINPADNKTSTSSSSSSSTKYKVGDTVTINGVYTSCSATRKLTPAVKSGKITKIVSGANNPYLLNNGDIGWVNDKCIVSKSGSSSSSTSKKKSTSEIAKEVIAGKWGTGATRKKKLEAAGYDYETVQAEVNRQLGVGSTKKKVTSQVVKDVINGKYGNGAARKAALEKAGYDYDEVQAAVNKAMA